PAPRPAPGGSGRLLLEAVPDRHAAALGAARTRPGAQAAHQGRPSGPPPRKAGGMKLASPPRLPLRAATRPRRGTQAPAFPLVETRVRARVAGALRACSAREQLVLVLLLYERLTPAEAATAL